MIAKNKVKKAIEKRQRTIDWLDSHDLPILPVCPDRIPEISNTKNPSFLDKLYIGHRINDWSKFAKTSTLEYRQRWFENPTNGVGTIAGVNNIYWLDIDKKYFRCCVGKTACQFFAIALWEKIGRQGFFGKTQSGGYRIALKLQQPIKTSLLGCSDDKFPTHNTFVGGILGAFNFAVLDSKNYEVITMTTKIPLVNLEDIGLVYYGTNSPSDIELDCYEGEFDVWAYENSLGIDGWG